MSGLTAWERWELASFDPEVPAATTAATEPTSAPVTAEDLDRVRQQAREEGYQAGYAAGELAGREAGAAAVRAEAERLSQAADSLAQSLAELDQLVADELLALAIEIARQVVLRDVTVRPDAMINVVREALLQLPHQHATIFLSPGDASLVRSYLGDALTHAGHRLQEDAKLSPGECLLEAGGSLLDASLAIRWRRVLENIGLDVAWVDNPQ